MHSEGRVLGATNPNPSRIAAVIIFSITDPLNEMPSQASGLPLKGLTPAEDF